ncbi:LLM class flavin-dependent oxidoreductase [Brumicola pallidula]|jgi:luciferase family oxidoreductase group 1|uniref:Luciferase-like monooxygenase n=1 Tax=Brumicola pallidula DSM 14239 = ACAM 615 TaxID=1121922 RepID=K6ZEL0_9ALTE|nr:LLM class flavin-dependent oxidoreductase [Glaciecola pallidula]GAC27353.1 luciferase family protein [Glaciecola pallidula DSM 14239 = ACAM 615]
MTLPFSLLDLAPIAEGASLADALENSRQLAVQAEKSGYHRIWLAEHHAMHGVASSATSVVLGHIAAATKSIRIGSGGVMLPNHSPLVIAEQFGTLATLFPGRVDLGLGRAPGTDMATARALRRNLNSDVDSYPEDIRELQHYLAAPQSGQRIVAVPGANTHIPLWLLGSSLYSAQLAAKFGLPYSFASHFAPDQLFDAINIYRSTFQASTQCDKPYVMAGVMVVVADTDEEATYLFTSVQQQFMNMRRGVNRPFARPVDDLSQICSAADQAMLSHILRYAVVGSSDTVAQKLTQFIQATEVDELIVSMPIHNVQARLKSAKMLAQTGIMSI